MSQFVRLNKNGSIFKDRATGFFIEKGQVKPLPNILGDLTRKWLQAGGLELCNPPETSAPSEAPVVQENIEPEPEVRSSNDRVAELEKFELKTLRQRCSERGIRFSYRSNKEQIISKIVDFEYGS